MAKVSDLFYVSYGHSLELNALEQSDNPSAINFVSRTAKNNGVSARVVSVPGETPSPANTLTVAMGGTVLETFLQPKPYYSGRDIAVLQPKREMTDKELLFWATAIRLNAYRYSYGRQANRTLGSVVLPDELPEWFAAAQLPDLSAAAASADTPVPLTDVATWKTFRVADLFTVKRGTFSAGKDGLNTADPFVPLVSATSQNNGISKMVQTQAKEDAGTLTVSINGSIGEVFYQPQPYVASSDVVILARPADAKPLSAQASLFFATVLRCERYRYNYGRKWKQGTLSDTKLPLPALPSGKPDWQLMEDFVNGQPFSTLAVSRRPVPCVVEHDGNSDEGRTFATITEASMTTAPQDPKDYPPRSPLPPRPTTEEGWRDRGELIVERFWEDVRRELDDKGYIEVTDGAEKSPNAE